MVVPKYHGQDLKWVEYTFKASEGPKEVSRLIIRSIDSNVDAIHSGSVILYRQNPESNFNRTINFPHPDDCVAAINFSDESGYFTADEREIIKNTYKIRINIDTFHTSSKTKSGFKADLFVKKVVSY